MGATVSITIRDCERINLVCELYHDKSRVKELFLAILKHGTEVEKISHNSSSDGKTLYLAEVICYITKRVDPFMVHFFHSDLLELDTNALSQIVAAAFDYAVKLGGTNKPRQTFVKQVVTNHKFAEMKMKYFSNFLAALVYFDHLWELFDLADDNIDDDSIFLGEFLRAQHKIEEIEGVKFLREVTEESWKKEFYKIDNGDEKDGWISFLEFARYAAHKIISPEDYIVNKVRSFAPEDIIDRDEKAPDSKRRASKRPKSRKSLAAMKIDKQPKIFGNNNDDTTTTASSTPNGPVSLKTAATAVEVAKYLDDTVVAAKRTSSGESSFARPKSMLARYNERLSRENQGQQSNRKQSLFKVTPSATTDDQEERGLAGEIKAKIVTGKDHVVGHRQSDFMARLLRDEKEILQDSKAAAEMEVSLELSKELIDQRKYNDKVSKRIENDEILPIKNRKHRYKRKTMIPTKQTVSPFSFSEIAIHHVKPGSYAAVCEEKRLQMLETFGKPIGEVEQNDYVDERVFSINNLNKVVNVLKARANTDNVRQESSGILTPRPRENSLVGSSAPPPTNPVSSSTPEDDDHSPSPSTTPTPISSSAKKKQQETSKDDAKNKMKFRNKIEKYIAEGQANNQLHQQQEKIRPKSASSSVTKTSIEEFERKSKPSQVQSFFNNYTDVDKGRRDVRPKTSSVFDRYAVLDKSHASGSLALSSKRGEGGAGSRDKVKDNDDHHHKSNNNDNNNNNNNNNNNGSPYIDDISTEPHLVRGKVFIDHGNRDQQRFGNLRFNDQVFNKRPRSGHFPSKHDTLQGKQGYELWDSKRNKSLQPPSHQNNQTRHQNWAHQTHERVPSMHTYTCKSPHQSKSKSPLRNR